MATKKLMTADALFQHLETLKTNRNKRYRTGEFFVEGVRNINEAVKNRWHIVSLCYTPDRPLSGWACDTIDGVKTDVNYELTPVLMDRLSAKTESSEIVAVVKMRDDDFSCINPSECPIIALFDRPSNKGNLGSVIRSCDAFGIDGLIITGHAVDLYDPEVIAATMGSFFSLSCVRATDNASLFDYITNMRNRYPDFKTVGTTAHSRTAIYNTDMTCPTLIMTGNEAEGLSRIFKENCDVLSTIPMSERSAATSFNAACAATAVFSEAIRQRNIMKK
ncbi:MAG: TrmH family RNA methyltransferase [Eubacteriales bacterium]|nr:TrmH family RNA methyltransferase [Eubacteriales bacterium]